jgi:hypothetical protein
MASERETRSTAAKRKFAKVVEVMSQSSNITCGGGKGFGSGALKVDGKIFAMLSSEGRFVVKLPKKRVDELVTSSVGKRFEPRPGKPMKEWLVVTASRENWTKLAKEACEFVSDGKS